ncbi:5139_t:CDS:10 [Dentiscutata heterogama]|uniref:5139_t:CDS:1 n=1 Tax=Dentiscutata heterogama TaxID=1316150 RepID=A0ACA9K4P1_9GLOM|nr:5139_t:CDS:10 [Dentiscutata heterogama]
MSEHSNSNDLDGIFNTEEAFIQFAHIFSQIHQSVDLQKAPEHYEKLCDQLLKKAQNEPIKTFPINTSQSRLWERLWEAERNTWNLIKQLHISTYPTEVSIPEKLYQTDGALQSELLATNLNFAEAWIVRQWLQDTAPTFVHVETNPEYWSYTKTHIMYSVKKLSHKYLDPDGSYRNGQALHPQDQIHENELAKSIYEYLRRGQLDIACEISKKNGQSWRAASISGYIVYGEQTDDGGDVDSIIKSSGNINRHLWRATCYQYAQEAGFDLYDRATYAALCGDVDNVFPVCRSWEDYTWAYFNGLIECRLEQYFSQRGQLGELGDVDLPVPTQLLSLTPDDIFRKVEARQTDRDPQMALFHKIQKLFILNKPDEIVKCLKEELLDKQLSYDDSASYSHILRFAAHFVLFLRDLIPPTPEKESDDLIKTYTELLIDFKQDSIIALYASKLPREMSIETYALFLKNITGSYDERFYFYNLAEKHGLDVTAIARRTSDLTLEEYLKEERYANALYLRIASLSDPVDPKDIVLIRGLEWLTFNKNQVVEAMDRANALFRRFLARGKLNAVNTLLSSMANPKSPLASYDLDKEADEHEETVVYEYSFYRNMFNFFTKYEDWVKIWQEKPQSPKSFPRDISISEWTLRIKETTDALDQLSDKFLTAYITNPEFDEDKIITEEEERRIQELQRVSDIYIPEVILRLHHVYFKTRGIIPGNLDKSLQLADLVADESRHLYMHFRRSKKLPVLLTMLRDSYLEITRENPDDIIVHC